MSELVRKRSIAGGIAAVFFAIMAALFLVPANAGVAYATPTTPTATVVPSAAQVEKAGTFKVDVFLSGPAGQTAPASAQVNVEFDGAISVSSFSSTLTDGRGGYNSKEEAWVACYISDSDLKYDSNGKLKIGSFTCKAPAVKGTYKVVIAKSVGSFAADKDDVNFNVGAPASITVVSPEKVTINKTMTAYTVSTSGTKKVDASESGVANKTRVCGDAGYCQLVSPSDGSAATAFPKVGALEAFTLGCSNGYKLAAFNVTYTDDSGKQVKLTVGNGLTRLGAYNPSKTTYEFTVPDAGDVTVNAVWERTVATIDKVLTSPAGTTSASTCEAGTCVMVATQSGIQATKYPLVGNDTAFKITTKAGYKLSAFNVTYTDEGGNLVKLTNGKGLTRVGAYKASENTYEFTVPNAPDVCVNVTWVK